jgi:hypothetical protein
MQLVVTDQDAIVLRGLLEAYLPELRREVARTEDHGLRHELVRRQELAERMLEQLGPGAAG